MTMLSKTVSRRQASGPQGPLSRPEASDLAALFKVLADPTRLRLLALLDSAPGGERCVHELFEDQVALRPDAVAVSSSDHRLTYAELDRRALLAWLEPFATVNVAGPRESERPGIYREASVLLRSLFA